MGERERGRTERREKAEVSASVAEHVGTVQR